MPVISLKYCGSMTSLRLGIYMGDEISEVLLQRYNHFYCSIMANLPSSIRLVELYVYGVIWSPAVVFGEVLGMFSWQQMFSNTSQLSALERVKIVVVHGRSGDAWRYAEECCQSTKDIILQAIQGTSTRFSTKHRLINLPTTQACL